MLPGSVEPAQYLDARRRLPVLRRVDFAKSLRGSIGEEMRYVNYLKTSED